MDPYKLFAQHLMRVSLPENVDEMRTWPKRQEEQSDVILQERTKKRILGSFGFQKMPPLFRAASFLQRVNVLFGFL